MNNKVKFELKPLTLVLLGVLIGALVTSVIFLSVGDRTVIDYRVDDGSKDSQPTTLPTAEPKNYRTDLRELTLESNSGSYKVKVPDTLYNLSDQYTEAMVSYYGSVNSIDKTLTLGNSTDLNSSSIMISAAALSSTRDIIKELNPSFTDDELDNATYSDAYILMSTGELPERENDTSKMEVTPIGEETLQGVVWHFYELSYVQSYYTSEDRTETIEVPIHEVAVYCEAEDSIEIIAYDSTGATDIDGLKEFVREMLAD